MNPQHHLDTSTIISYAAGSLPEALAAVAATHFGVCRHCREQLRDAEDVGGQLLAQKIPVATDPSRLAELRASMLEQLEGAPLPVHSIGATQRVADESRNSDRLPEPLHPYFGKSYRALRWRWVAPGVRYLGAANISEGKLFLLKIAPGKSMPVHSHGGSEITQILQGAYDDALGHFGPGDMADLDGEVEHQPVTSQGVPCICVAALDAPLRFSGWLARTLQPLMEL